MGLRDFRAVNQRRRSARPEHNPLRPVAAGLTRPGRRATLRPSVHVSLLSRGLSIYTTRRLAQAARLRGARVRVLDPLGVEMHLDDGPAAFYRQRKLPPTDVVVPRIAPSIQAYGLAVVNHFGMMGVPTLNDATAIASSRDGHAAGREQLQRAHLVPAGRDGRRVV